MNTSKALAEQNKSTMSNSARWFIRFTLMLFARLAYLSVLRLSSKLHAAGERAASIAVSELPPRDSCKTRVSLEFRYGTNTPFLPFATSTSALMTLPRLHVRSLDNRRRR